MEQPEQPLTKNAGFAPWLDQEGGLHLKYINAKTILPEALIEELQNYVQAGYIYVPAPWWKTDYFEIRYENPAENRRYFYQLDGEGIRYEIVAFLKSIEKGRSSSYVEEEVSEAIAGVMEDFYSRRDTRTI